MAGVVGGGKRQPGTASAVQGRSCGLASGATVNRPAGAEASRRTGATRWPITGKRSVVLDWKGEKRRIREESGANGSAVGQRESSGMVSRPDSEASLAVLGLCRPEASLAERLISTGAGERPLVQRDSSLNCVNGRTARERGYPRAFVESLKSAWLS